MINPDQATEAWDRIKGFISGREASINHEERWGTRRLAYPIRKGSYQFLEGNYHLTRFATDRPFNRELETFLKLDDNVIRSMVIATLPEDELAAQAAAQTRAIRPPPPRPVAAAAPEGAAAGAATATAVAEPDASASPAGAIPPAAADGEAASAEATADAPSETVDAPAAAEEAAPEATADAPVAAEEAAPEATADAASETVDAPRRGGPRGHGRCSIGDGRCPGRCRRGGPRGFI
jgi:ribosomal protein S6